MTGVEKLAGMVVVLAAGLGAMWLASHAGNDVATFAVTVATMFAAARLWVGLFEEPDR